MLTIQVSKSGSLTVQSLIAMLPPWQPPTSSRLQNQAVASPSLAMAALRTAPAPTLSSAAPGNWQLQTLCSTSAIEILKLSRNFAVVFTFFSFRQVLRLF